uniref:Ribonuclease T2 family protein n=1 Tax=Arundo donax TaxID=35708 RepID=A0A0A9GRG8_ARUDO
MDAEVRRRLAGLGVAAALLRVAVRPRPLQHEVEEVVVLRRAAPGGANEQQEGDGELRRRVRRHG